MFMLFRQSEEKIDVDQKSIGKGVGFERTRRITGYLVGTVDRFNDAKERKKKIGSSTVPSLRVNGIVEESIVDGPGLRYVIFTQGCPHGCKGCHNPDTHAYDGGYIVSDREVIDRFLENPLLAGITFSGGEPFLQPEPLCLIADEVVKAGKNVVVYTGYTYEYLMIQAKHNSVIHELLKRTDILIDGPYIAEQRSLELAFRGSTNQRVLDKLARESLSSFLF